MLSATFCDHISNVPLITLSWFDCYVLPSEHFRADGLLIDESITVRKAMKTFLLRNVILCEGQKLLGFPRVTHDVTLTDKGEIPRCARLKSIAFPFLF